VAAIMTQPGLRTHQLFDLTWPIFLQQTTQSVIVLMDFWFFSRISDAAAATVGQLTPIIWVGTFMIPVFAGTGVAVASQYMGAKQYEKVVPAYMVNLAISALLGLVFALALRFFATDIGRWMGLGSELREIGAAYLGTISTYFVFMSIYVAYSAVLSSRGMTHWLMSVSVTVAALNGVLAWLFLEKFHWGVRGVAWASVASMALAAVTAIWLVHRRLGVHFYLRGAWRDMRGVIAPMLRIGIPNALEPFSYSVQQIILSALIIPLGLTAMAANGYAGRLQMLQITFSVALSLGAQILMGHWMGARRFDDVNQLFWRITRYGLVVAGCYALTLWLFSDQILGWFTHDPAIKYLGRTLLLIAVFYEPARAVNIVSSFTLKSVGDSVFPLIVTMTFIWGILPVVLWIDHVWGMTIVGFWLCFAADEIIRAGINLVRWRSGRWRSKGIVSPAPEPERSLIT
jgi:putative MATE family efflux protein